jgi:hypothetical protein
MAAVCSAIAHQLQLLVVYGMPWLAAGQSNRQWAAWQSETLAQPAVKSPSVPPAAGHAEVEREPRIWYFVG